MADENQTEHDGVAATKIQTEQLLQQNEALQTSMTTIQQQQHEQDKFHQEEVDEPDPQPLSTKIKSMLVPKNFKPPSMSTFDGKGDTVEHVTTFNTQMPIIGALESLK